MLQGDPRLYTVASYVKTGVDKSVNDLRDKRLLTFDQDKLSRVELAAKKQDIEFGRDKDHWQIVKPKPYRADGTSDRRNAAQAQRRQDGPQISADDAKKAAAAFASGTPVATVKLTDPSGTQQIEVRKSKDDYYAKSSAVQGVFKVHRRPGNRPGQIASTTSATKSFSISASTIPARSKCTWRQVLQLSPRAATTGSPTARNRYRQPAVFPRQAARPFRQQVRRFRVRWARRSSTSRSFRWTTRPPKSCLSQTRLGLRRPARERTGALRTRFQDGR